LGPIVIKIAGVTWHSAADPEPRPETQWGQWVLTCGGTALRHKTARYEINLESCRDSASVLDWIAQVAGKSWASAEDLGDLVLALDSIFHLQSKFCGFGKDHGIDPRPLLRARQRRVRNGR
jgi:hypothetical protein